MRQEQKVLNQFALRLENIWATQFSYFVSMNNRGKLVEGK